MRRAILLCLLAASIATPGSVHAQSDDTGPLFSNRDLYFAGGFVAGTILMLPLDRLLATELQDSTRQASEVLQFGSDAIGDFGRTGAFIIGPTMYVVGRLAGSERFADLGLHGTQALLVAEATNRLVKFAAGRARPYLSQNRDPTQFRFMRGLGDPEHQSFVSGHSAIAFAAAAAVQQEVEEWWPNQKLAIGTVMFGGATLVALSRMYDNKHWASDVVGGAAIGAFAGWKVVRWNHTSAPDNKLNNLLLGVSISPSGDLSTARLWIAPIR